MKIAVIGYSGAGKSTLARKLGKIYGEKVLHLDALHFAPDWIEREPEQVLEEVLAFMGQPGWIIDGNYSRYAETERLTQADEIVFLDFPRRICLWRVLRRYWNNRGRVRESMAAGCKEKLDGEFIAWVLWAGRTKKKKENYQRICNEYYSKTKRLSNQREVKAYLTEIEKTNNQ